MDETARTSPGAQETTGVEAAGASPEAPTDDARVASRRAALLACQEALEQLAAAREEYGRTRFGSAERRAAAEACRWAERLVGERAPKGLLGGHGGDRKRAAYVRELSCTRSDLCVFRRLAEIPLARFVAALEDFRRWGRQPSRAEVLSVWRRLREREADAGAGVTETTGRGDAGRPRASSKRGRGRARRRPSARVR